MTDPGMENLIDAGHDFPESLEDPTMDDLEGVGGIGPTLAERIKEIYS